MTHEHDIELILAIAEGSLAPDEQAAAETLLLSCQVCRSDLQLQREAVAALHAAPPVVMTDLERGSLHRAVAEKIILAPRTERVRPGLPWFQRLMPAMAAAAALLVVVGVGSVLIDRTGGADVAAEATTTAAATTREQADEKDQQADAVSEAGSDGELTSTTMMASAAPLLSVFQDYGPITSAELADIAAQLMISQPTPNEEVFSPDSLRSSAVEPALVCAETAINEGSITAVGRATVDGDAVEIYRIDDLVKVFSTTDCSLTNLFE